MSSPLPLTVGDRVQPFTMAARYGRIVELNRKTARVEWDDGGFGWYALRTLAYAPDPDCIADLCREIRLGLGHVFD